MNMRSHDQSGRSGQKGVTLIELMIALVLLGILFSFAVPAYQSSIDTSQEGVVRSNIMGMEIFQEDFFLRTGGYANDLGDIAAIEGSIGWAPQSDDGSTYSIAASDGTRYDVTAVHPDGLTVCIRLPAREACP
ncbi:MAG: prepilin-type N-terminal cleavage/methylation domain-containing protein [Pseudomonadales bacterium]|nr:prepilin-type N-terminal cleavage/methylation domain-containing protein [Pseudomonadales bacterium]